MVTTLKRAWQRLTQARSAWILAASARRTSSSPVWPNPPEKMSRRLFLLSKLIIYLDQLNPAVFSEDTVAWYIQDFLSEHAGVTD